MKPLSERDENLNLFSVTRMVSIKVGMKPLSERDENPNLVRLTLTSLIKCRNEATL